MHSSGFPPMFSVQVRGRQTRQYCAYYLYLNWLNIVQNTKFHFLSAMEYIRAIVLYVLFLCALMFSTNPVRQNALRTVIAMSFGRF